MPRPKKGVRIELSPEVAIRLALVARPSDNPTRLQRRAMVLRELIRDWDAPNPAIAKRAGVHLTTVKRIRSRLRKMPFREVFTGRKIRGRPSSVPPEAVKAARNELLQKDGREPTVTEVASMVGCSRSAVGRILRKVRPSRE